jgi:uncharacterized protein (DUF1778 family)
VITNRIVARLNTYIHMRITANEQKRWKEAAALRGQTLSELVRTAIEAELAAPAIKARVGVTAPSVAQQPHPARAKAPATLEERLQAIGELVDGLGS